MFATGCEMKNIVTLILFLLFSTQAYAAQEAKRPPNVVIIFCDDLGYGDVGCFGSKNPTPHIDKMAREGVRFTNFYVAQAVCSASRVALLTGRYPNRVGILGALGPADKKGLGP